MILFIQEKIGIRRKSQILRACLACVSLLALIYPTALLQAQASNERQAIYNRALSELIAENIDGVNDISDLELSDFRLSSDEDEPTNLYLLMFNQEFGSVHNLALQNTALFTEFSIFTVRDAVEKGSSDDLTGNQAEIADKLSKIRSIYAQELELAQESANLLKDTFFFDSYANGVRDDNDFDLISDLQEIHELLFTGRPDTPVDSDPNKRGKNPLAKKSTPSTSNDQNSNESENLTRSQAQELTNENTEISSDKICQAEPELLELLKDHDRQQKQAETTQGVNNGEQTRSTQNSLNQLNTYQPRNLADLINPIERECEEGTIFCVTIDKIFTRTENYFPEDQSCVACQITKINKVLNEQLLPEDLAPSKVTGSFGQPAICSAASLRIPIVDFNFSLESKPLRDKSQAELELLREIKAGDEVANNSPAQRLDEINIVKRISSNNTSLTDLTGATSKTRTEFDATKRINSNAAAGVEAVSDTNGFTKNLQPRIQEFNGMLEQIRAQIVEIEELVIQLSNKPACSA